MELLNQPQTKEERKRLKAIRRAEKESRQDQKAVVIDSASEKVTVLCVKLVPNTAESI